MNDKIVAIEKTSSKKNNYRCTFVGLLFFLKSSGQIPLLADFRIKTVLCQGFLLEKKVSGVKFDSQFIRLLFRHPVSHNLAHIDRY